MRRIAETFLINHGPLRSLVFSFPFIQLLDVRIYIYIAGKLFISIYYPNKKGIPLLKLLVFNRI